MVDNYLILKIKLNPRDWRYMAENTGLELMISYQNRYHPWSSLHASFKESAIIEAVIRLHHQLASWLYLRKPSLRSTAPLQFHHRKFLFPWPRQGAVPFKDNSQKPWPQPPWSYVTFFHQEPLRPQLICGNRQIYFFDFRITWISPLRLLEILYISRTYKVTETMSTSANRSSQLKCQDNWFSCTLACAPMHRKMGKSILMSRIYKHMALTSNPMAIALHNNPQSVIKCSGMDLG